MNLKCLLSAAVISAATLGVSAQNAKYGFYFIGDGMGLGPGMTAETYNREVLKNDKPLTMMQFPTVSWCMTYSASSPVDSAVPAAAESVTGELAE